MVRLKKVSDQAGEKLQKFVWCLWNASQTAEHLHHSGLTLCGSVCLVCIQTKVTGCERGSCSDGHTSICCVLSQPSSYNMVAAASSSSGSWSSRHHASTLLGVCAGAAAIALASGLTAFLHNLLSDSSRHPLPEGLKCDFGVVLGYALHRCVSENFVR